MRAPAIALAVGLTVSACSSTDARPDAAPSSTSTSTTAVATPPPSTATTDPTQAPSTPATPLPRLTADDVDVTTAVEAVRHLAGEIGSRPGHTPAFRRAADWVQRELEGHGWTVTQQRFPTPAGSYEGVDLAAGPSTNVVATLGDLEPGEPWLAVGAHLDTVPQGPGAEDNASGVGVVLALAEAIATHRTRLPVVLVAFGSEEPRGPGDDDHHFGSRAFVADLSRAQRRSLEAMVSLDRVGVGTVVPVGSAAEPNSLTDALVAAAERVDVPTQVEVFERSSDHWSFVRDGLPGARIGSTPYAGYHGPGDVPSVVSRAQLERVGRLLAAWLR